MTLWTDEQKAAISASGRAVLVSAAAGSGKTAVLVEKLLRLLTDRENPVSADRIIVVTFTRDAAAQMRDKLTEKLTELMESTDTSEEEAEKIAVQLSLLPTANISTIHSFCFRLIRENAGKAGVDPAFAIAPPEDEEEMIDKAISEVFGEWVQSRGDEVTLLTDFFCGGERNMEGLTYIIKELRKKYLSLPFPGDRMESLVSYYRENSEHLSPDKGITAEYIRLAVGIMKNASEAAQALGCYLCDILKKLSGHNDDPKTEKNLRANIETVNEDHLLLAGLYRRLQGEAEAVFSGESDYFSLFDDPQPVQAGKLKTDKKTGEVTGYSKRSVGAVRYEEKGTVRDIGEVIKNVRKIYFGEAAKLYEIVNTGAGTFSDAPPMRFTEEQIKSDYRRHAEILETLFALLSCVTERESLLKARRNVLGYSDAEQICCSLLCRREGGSILPSETALAVSETADIVMIDEFQDSTEVQELIFRMISRGGNAHVPGRNFFAVGDVKQSIYRFRSAEPELFMKSLRQSVPYEDNGDTSPSHVLLKKNFRSSRPVVDFVNRLFRTVMSERLGGVDYGEAESLVYGRSENADPPPTEIIDISEGTALHLAAQRLQEGEELPGKPSGEDMLRAEAAAAARLIRQLLDDDPAARPSHFCILSRYKKYLPLFEQALEKEGIPCSCGERENILETGEVLAVVNLLKAIDNPWKDVPLMSAMMSPLFMFTAEEMAQIRLFGGADKGGASLYGRIFSALQNEESPASLREQCREFLERFDSLRGYALTHTARELILHVYEDMDYISLIAGMPEGRKKVRYLRRLPFAAQDAAGQGDSSLRGFIKRLESLGSGGIPAPAAGTPEAVVLQTVHGSKGLQYPYVFLCSSHYKSKRTGREGFFFNQHFGVGLDITENTEDMPDAGALTPRERLQYVSLPSCTIKAMTEKSELDEDMMLLYVALTRAEKQLFITRARGQSEVKKSRAAAALAAGSAMAGLVKCDCAEAAVSTLSDIISAGLTGFESVTDAEFFTPGSSEVCLRSAADILDITEDILEDESEETDVPESETEAGTPEDETEETAVLANEEMTARIKELLALSQETELSGVPAKLTVTELAGRREAAPEKPPVFNDCEEAAEEIYDEDQSGGYPDEDFSEDIIRPVSGKLSAADRGTAVHGFMQYVDLKRLLEAEDREAEVRSELEELTDRGLLTKEQAGAVDPEVIGRFAAGELFSRMMKAGEIMRERKFLVKISDLGLDDADLKVYTNTEGCLQGVADLIFREDDGYVLCDYKTDRRAAAQSLIMRYGRQISLYAAAFSIILDAPVKEAWIYSFGLNGKGGAVRIF